MSSNANPVPRLRLKPHGGPKPQLVYFFSARSSPSRRVEGYLAQVLQRRASHHAFRLRRVDVDQQPTLSGCFGIKTLPTLVVIDNKHLEARLEAPTLEQPSGELPEELCRTIEDLAV
jgi:hypothetical protein